jgi:hypothetical protein
MTKLALNGRLMMLWGLCFLFLRIAAVPVASFPLQLSATITITAHLIDADSEYPPRMRRMTIMYDYIGKIS